MAAGLGFKTFTTGEVLTAADVNGYLMQGILVFASAAARDAAITAPQEGQFAFLKDTNVTTYYTGSAWANVDTTGMTNPMTTTGDVIYSSSGSTPARLGIGTAGQLLAVNSGATAPEWVAAPSSVSAATQSDLETATSTTVYTSPGRQQYHPSASKGWAHFNGTTPYAINASYNVSSVSSVGTAQYRVNWDVDFSSANYAYAINCEKLATDAPTTATMIVCNPFTLNTAYIDFALMCVNGTRTESSKVVAIAFGDQ